MERPATAEPAAAAFPSAASILAAQGSRPIARPDPPGATVAEGEPKKSRPRGPRRPTPTEPAEPGMWTFPTLVAGPIAATAAVAASAVGLILGLAWMKDGADAGVAVSAVLRDGTSKPVAIDPAARPETRWWKTTAGRMSAWAVAIERSPEGPRRGDEVRDALAAARSAAPLEPTARFALAQPVAGEPDPPEAWAVGLSRDVVSLALTGRSLKKRGRPAAAIRAYRAALEAAADVAVERLDPPAFDDDPKVRRYRLPHEGMAGAILRDMADAGDWSYADWSTAVTTRAVVRLAAARLLRERSSPDAERVLATVLEVNILPAPGSLEEAEHHAAEAEALAMMGRPAEAAERYRKAIAVVNDDRTRRRWRLGLAELAGSLGQASEREQLLEAAKSADPTDDVTRRALSAQRFAGLRR